MKFGVGPNLGDIIAAAGILASLFNDRPLYVIAILLCLILSELARIRKNIEKKGAA